MVVHRYSVTTVGWGGFHGASSGVRGPILRPGCFIKYLRSTVLLSDTLQNSCRLARYGRRLKSSPSSSLFSISLSGITLRTVEPEMTAFLLESNHCGSCEYFSKGSVLLKMVQERSLRINPRVLSYLRYTYIKIDGPSREQAQVIIYLIRYFKFFILISRMSNL